MNKQKFVAQIEVQAIISQAQKELAKLGKDVNKSWQNGSPPKSTLKQLESMRTRMASIKELTRSGEITNAGLANVTEDYKGLAKEIRNLTIEYQLFTKEQKIAMLSQEEQKALRARAEAMDTYTESIKRNAQARAKEKESLGAEKAKAEARKAEVVTSQDEKKKKLAGLADFDETKAKKYLETLKQAEEYENKIAEKKKFIAEQEKKYVRDDGKTKLSQAKQDLANLEKQKADLDLVTGKEDADRLKQKQSLELDIAADTNQINEIQTEIDELAKSIKEIDTKDLDKLKESLKKCGVEGIEDAENFEEIKKKVQALDKQALSKADAAIKRFLKTLNGMEQELGEVGEAIDDANASLKRQEEQLQRMNAIEDRIKSFLGFAGATEVLKTSARRAMATIKELDATMTEMAVVTDLTVGDYWDQLPQYSKQASDLGVSINSAYRAATLYYQQGLKTNEVNAISVETLKMARIAGLDASTATDKMTAALRGFNMELNETSAQRVSDVYSELAAITAADTKEIANAMTKTASIASNAGMEFETTAAFLSQIIETTRESAETAGTAMKTVIARFQELKKDPAEIGEVDGEIVDANKIETALRSVGVSLRDANGQFRALDEVFLELSSKWDTLDTNTQRYIATIAAGSRQQSRFIAMMSDYGRTQELVAAANNSAGASNRQFEKTMDSLESKLEKLKNAWDEFSMGILNSDLVKVGVDILTKFLEIVNKATSTFDGLGGSIMKIISVITLFKLGQKIFDKFKQPLMRFFADVVAMVRDTGFKSGEAYVKAVRQGGQSAQTKKTTTTTEPQDNKQKFLQATGLSDILQGGKQAFTKNEEDEVAFNKLIYGDKVPTSETRAGRKAAIAAAREQRVKAVNDAKAPIEQQKAYFEDMKAGRNGVLTKKGKLFSKNSNEYRKAEKMSQGTKEQQDALKAAEEELKKFDDTQRKVQMRAAEGWAQAGQGLQKMGMEIAAVGVGVSMLGGLFDALGMEEVGEAFSTFGNILTVVGTGISAVGTALSAIPPLLTLISSHPIVAIIVAACAVILLAIVGITKALKEASLENRMAKAAEATEKAKTAAKEAKEVYDELLTERDGYDEMQRNLEELTYGTKEWKEALHEVNEQVLKLLQTYPELSKYLSRGDEGQLIITDEGWDALIKEQERAVANTQNLVLSKQMTEQNLKEEEARTRFDKEARNSNAQVTRIVNGNAVLTDASYMLQNELEEIYLLQNSTLAEQASRVDELAEKYHTSSTEIWAVADALAESKDQILAVVDATENVARANLTAQASKAITESKLGDEVIDAFSQSVDSKEETRRADEIFNEMERAYVDTNLRSYAKTEQGKNIKAIADAYGVNLEAGSDKQNLQEMYSKMTGKTMQEVKDTKMSKADLAKEISAMWVGNERNTKMEEYLDKLEELAQTDEKTANDVSSIFADDGRTMTLEFANELMSGDNKQFSSEVLKKQAEKLGYDSLDAWAKALNKTEAELLKEAEDNARKAQITNKKTFDQLNRVLGRADGDIIAFGTNLRLTVENQAALAQKMVSVTQMAGKEAGNSVQDLLDILLDSAGEDADKMAEVLKGINWSNAEDISFEKLSELLQNLNIQFSSDALELFTKKIETIGVVVETVNFDKLNQELNTTRKLIESIQSGEQGRLFSKENYDALVKANEEIAKQFVQIGDEFHYVGASLQELSNTLKKNMVLDLGKAGYQLEKQIEIAKSVRAFSEATDVKTFGADKLDAIKGTKDWSEADKRLYLEQYRAFALDNNVNTLEYVTDEQGNSLGMSLSMNFNEATETQLDAYIAGLLRLENSTEKMTEDYSKAMSDYRVNSYTLEEASSIVSGARRERKNGNEAAADEYSKALSIEASNSGLVAESVIAKYNELVKANYSELSQSEKEQMDLYENTMLESLEQGTNSLEQLEAVNDMTQRVADAMYNIAQQEIEKLSNINDSINTTNERLVNKIQEQINDARQAREIERTKQDLAQDQSQLAYLMSDTSGAGALEAQALQQQIAEKQQSYQDTLIDQSLQKISDDNAAAAEQRERQIALMQEQLEFNKENGTLAREAENITTTALEAISNGTSPLDTKMYSILEQSETISGGMATKAEQDAFKQTFTEQATTATDAYDTLKKTTSEIAIGLAAAQKELADWIAGKDESNTDEQTGGKKAVEDTAIHREAAVSKALSRATKGGDWAGDILKTDQEFLDAYAQYRSAGGGTQEEFYNEVIGRAVANTKSGKGDEEGGWDLIGIPYGQRKTAGLNDAENKWFNLTIGGDEDPYVETGKEQTDTQRLTELYLATTGEGGLSGGEILFNKANDSLYVYGGTAWYQVLNQGANMDGSDKPKRMANKAREVLGLEKFKTGGIADFTGPAWLDGTKSRPELVLNARDTQNFIQLKDILAEIMDKGGMSDNSTSNGDNYFDIQINVEDISDDYDVEQLANKIRSMIYEDATYRNVNAVSHISR